MVLKREVVERRLEELDVILEELAKHRGVDRVFEVVPAFARHVMDWLEEVPDDER